MSSANHERSKRIPCIMHNIMAIREVVDNDEGLGEGLLGLCRLQLLHLPALLVEDLHQSLLVPIREEAVLLQALRELADGVPGAVDLDGREDVEGVVD